MQLNEKALIQQYFSRLSYGLAVTYLQFPIPVCFSATVSYHSSCWMLSSCFPRVSANFDLDFRIWPTGCQVEPVCKTSLLSVIDFKSYCLDTDTLPDKVVDNHCKTKAYFKEETRRGRLTHTHCQSYDDQYCSTH